jgi:hypothetical protein
MNQARRDRSAVIVVTKIAGFCVVFVIGYALFNGFVSSYALARSFPGETLQEYESLFKWSHASSSDSSMPPRTGKVVIVRPSVWNAYSVGHVATTQFDPAMKGKVEERESPPHLDDSFYQIDSFIRASSPDEVETVILAEYSQRKYVREGIRIIRTDGKGNGSVYVRRVRFYVYDWKKKEFLGTHLIESFPVARGKYHVTGPAPDVAEFIESMPTR